MAWNDSLFSLVVGPTPAIDAASGGGAACGVVQVVVAVHVVMELHPS